MPPPTRPPATRLSPLVGLGLALAGVAAAGEGGELAGLRLSGVVLVAGEPERAVIERRNGAGQIVRRGDQLPDIGAVSNIAPTWIRLETPEGPRLVYLGSPPGAPAPPPAPEPARPAAAPPEEGHVMARSATATPEILKAIARLAAKPGASDAELSLVLIPLLDLPGDARVSSFFPGEPEREAKGPAGINAALTQGEMVRLRIEAGGQQQMIYLTPGQPAGTGPTAAP